MKKFLASVCVMAMAVFGANQVKAASVDVDVDITLQGFLILYCYDDINVSISPANLGDALGLTNDSGNAIVKGSVPSANITSPSAGNLEADLDIDSEATISSVTPTVTLNLKDICGVRAIAASGRNVSVSAGSAASTLTASTAANGSIGVSNVATNVTDLTITNGLGGALNTFDVSMELDLSSVVGADTFAASGSATEFTVTVTNL